MSMLRWMGLGMVAAALLACPGPTQRNKVQIGAVLSTTGDLSNIGAEQLDAANLAVAEINAAGGVLDSDLEMVQRDDGTDSAKGKTAAQALVDLKVVAAVGAVGSAITLSAASVTAPAKIPLVSASSTSPLLTTATDDGYLFRTCPSDASQGKLLAKRAKAKGFTKMAVVYIPGAYGKGLADTFAATFTAGGGTITYNQEYTEGQSSYNTLLTALYAAGKPDAVLLVAYPIDGATMIKDYLQNYSTNQTFWFFTDALEDTGFITGVGGSLFTFAHEGTGPGTPTGARYDSFKAAFKSKYSKDANPGAFSPNAYDAVYLIALAMQAGGVADGTKIRDSLTAISGSATGTKYGPTDFAAAVADLKAGKTINFEGTSGAVDLDASGDVQAPYDVWKVAGGAISVIESNVNP